MHLEGKTNGDARGREIATCAAVGAEIQTCIQRLVRAWPLEPTSGRGTVSPRSPGGHRVSPLGEIEDAALLDPRSGMQGTKKSRETSF